MTAQGRQPHRYEGLLIGRTCRSSFTAEKLIDVTGERPVSKMANSHFRPEAAVHKYIRALDWSAKAVIRLNVPNIA